MGFSIVKAVIDAIDVSDRVVMLFPSQLIPYLKAIEGNKDALRQSVDKSEVLFKTVQEILDNTPKDMVKDQILDYEQYVSASVV